MHTMDRPLSKTFSSFVAVPENRAALLAAQNCVSHPGIVNPLFLFGSAGAGKSHLCQALIDQHTRRHPDATATVLSASDWRPRDDDSFALREVDTDLLIVEDLQHLPAAGVQPMLNLLDDQIARDIQVVVTAARGPGQLDLPARLTSRLSAGLVVALELPGRESRQLLIARLTARRGLDLDADTSAWLSGRLASVRQIEGAAARLETLARTLGRTPTSADLADELRVESDSSRLTLEKVASVVGRQFGVNSRQLCSKQRKRGVLLPRQIGMFLARKLMGLPFQQIGSFFGGRDHTTVLHACRKIETDLTRDPILGGNVRLLSASLA